MKSIARFGLPFALLLSLGCKQAAQTILGYEEPAWIAVVNLADGRVFVTDERIALDVVWAKPEALPTRTFPAEGIEFIIQRQERSGSFESFNVNAVSDVGVDGAVRGEGGVLLDPKYTEYLRWHFAMHEVRLHAWGTNTDVVISIDGEFAGALAPMTLER